MKKYETILFDCDGVIFNSNKIKSQVFYDVTYGYSIQAAQELVEYNQQYGGISRHEKFKYFVNEILPKFSHEKPSESALIASFAKHVKQRLMKCEVSPYLRDIACKFSKTQFAVVSGGYEPELREIFQARELYAYFSGGIWGSPDTKFQIIEKHFSKLNPRLTLFIGDSELDYDVAKFFGFDFVFVSGWTELRNWKNFVYANNILHITDLKGLLQ